MRFQKTLNKMEERPIYITSKETNYLQDNNEPEGSVRAGGFIIKKQISGKEAT